MKHRTMYKPHGDMRAALEQRKAKVKQRVETMKLLQLIAATDPVRNEREAQMEAWEKIVWDSHSVIYSHQAANIGPYIMDDLGA